MQIELVSNLGARLPKGDGPLRFGATEADARQRLEAESPADPPQTSRVRSGPWTWRARIGNRWIEASAGGDGLLGEIRVARAIEPITNTMIEIPVIYRGIDVFRHTMAEVEFLLGATTTSVATTIRDLRLTGPSGYALSVTLIDPTRPNSPTPP